MVYGRECLSGYGAEDYPAPQACRASDYTRGLGSRRNSANEALIQYNIFCYIVIAEI